MKAPQHKQDWASFMQGFQKYANVCLWPEAVIG